MNTITRADYKNAAATHLAWEMLYGSRCDLVDKQAVIDGLADFGVALHPRVLTYALQALGIEGELRSRSGERGGPRAYFDPIVVWTISLVYRRDRRLLRNGTDVLRPFVELAKDLGGLWQASWIPSFVEEPTFAAQLLLLGSLDFGMDPLSREIQTNQHPGRLAYVSWGEAFMRDVLASWDEAYMDAVRTERHSAAAREDAERSYAMCRAFVEILGERIAEDAHSVEILRTLPKIDMNGEDGDVGEMRRSRPDGK